MQRRLFGLFTGTHLTLLAGIAMIVPGALVAAVTFQPVTIVDPNSGAKSFVDAGRKLSVYDPIAGFRNLPANSVTIAFRMDTNGRACVATSYPVPTGKALVLTSMTGANYLLGTAKHVDADVYDGPSCTGNVVAYSTSSQPQVDINQDFGSGMVIPAGKTLTVLASANGGIVFLHGYLIPASAAPH